MSAPAPSKLAYVPFVSVDNMVGSGIHINAIGGDCPGKTELHKDILPL